MALGIRRLRAALAIAAMVGLYTPLAGSAERELAADADAFVEVEVATVAVAQPNATPVVLLREPDESRIVPIFVGPAQARSILRVLRGMDTPRPMTHDLMGNVIDALDARLERVYVDDLRDDTFYGMLEFEVSGRDEPLRVDTRPSDAIALALRAGASMHIARRVIEATASIDYRGLDREQVVTAAGITVMASRPELREALELPERDGLVVTEAVGPAAGAGLSAGALILEINGQAPESPMAFLQRVRETPEGEPITLRYWQDGEEHTIEVPTGIPDQPQQAATPAF